MSPRTISHILWVRWLCCPRLEPACFSYIFVHLGEGSLIYSLMSNSVFHQVFMVLIVELKKLINGSYSHN